MVAHIWKLRKRLRVRLPSLDVKKPDRTGLSNTTYIYSGNATDSTGAGEMVHYPYRDLVVQPPMPPMHSNMPASSILEKNPSQSFSIYRNPSGNCNTLHLHTISLNPFISFQVFIQC
jgi:hypothetical protein